MARSQVVSVDAGILGVLGDRKRGTVLLPMVLCTFYDGAAGAYRASQKVT